MTAHSGDISEIMPGLMTSAEMRSTEDGHVRAQTQNESTGKQTDRCHGSSLHLCVKQEGTQVCPLLPALNVMTNCKGLTLETHMKNPKHQHDPHSTQKTARDKDG